MSIAVVEPQERPWHWLRGARFDRFFILGLPAIGLTAAAISTAQPALFLPILIIDLWLLGYHHVISTYTRLCFDWQSFRSSRFMIFGLLPMVAVATVAMAMAAGVWVIVSIYFYWQWWHYTRQSWGISRAYRGKDKDGLFEDGKLDQAIFYGLPIWGVLYRSYQDPGTFIGLELRVVPVPEWLVTMAGVICIGLLAYWLVRRFQALQQGRLAAVHTLYMLTHFVMFMAAYLLIEDITYGWLAINIWHNGQYILFVWLFNTRRFKDGIDPKARFLSYISQPNRLWLYLLTCVGITGVVYWGVLGSLSALMASGVAATIVIYQIVNFHHYIVDSMIWKVRKPAIRTTLGIS